MCVCVLSENRSLLMQHCVLHTHRTYIHIHTHARTGTHTHMFDRESPAAGGGRQQLDCLADTKDIQAWESCALRISWLT